MPWQDNNNKNGKTNGPWGSGGGLGGGYESGALNDILEKFQETLKKKLPSGKKGLLAIIAVIILLWGATGIYRVQPGQNGIELVFGGLYETTEPGLHYNFPSPIGTVYLPEVERSRRIDIGYRSVTSGGKTVSRDVLEQSLILTGDENIVDMDFSVFWKVSDAVRYLFVTKEQEKTITAAAESVMREVVGQTTFDLTVTTGRDAIEQQTATLLQEVLDGYDMGILVERIVLQKSDPPSEVIDAFNDVQRARQDRDRMRNEAEAYANSVVPKARGQAQQVILEAEAYKEKLLQEAEGEAKRFLSVYNSYKESPEVTRKRMHLEALSDIFAKSSKVLLDEDGGAPVIPLLPLQDYLQKRGGEER